jgi:hypothetical protein
VIMIALWVATFLFGRGHKTARKKLRFIWELSLYAPQPPSRLVSC